MSRPDPAERTVEDPPTESLLPARQAHRCSETDERLKPGHKLGDVYLERTFRSCAAGLSRFHCRNTFAFNAL